MMDGWGPRVGAAEWDSLEGGGGAGRALSVVVGSWVMRG